MNKVILMGRLTRDPDVRVSTGERQMSIARYTLAVDRRGRRTDNGGEQTADSYPALRLTVRLNLLRSISIRE